MERKLRSRRGVSPVIATVILVAVAITVAVAVAYWMGGIAGQYTQFEKVEIQSSYASKINDLTVGAETNKFRGWKVTIQLRNTGSAPATLIKCFVNDKPTDEYVYDTSQSINWYSDEETTLIPESGLTIDSGVSATIYVYIDAYYVDMDTHTKTDVTFTSGTTINLKLHSSGGMDYIKLVQLT